MKDKKVLVTGVTGFIGSHVAAQLLKNGYSVRGTLRDLRKKEKVIEMLQPVSQDAGMLEFIEANLTQPGDWDAAMQDIDYVMHVASPMPTDLKKHASDLIQPAKEGTLNVLKAAEKHGVKRMVQTSSIAAIGHGHHLKDAIYTEEDWTNLKKEKKLFPYIRSKTIAEKEAWKFVNSREVQLELAVINPGYVFGPLIGKIYSDSALIIKKALEGDMPGLPKISFPIVDVRDVAEMHMWALEKPEAAGLRYICVNGNMTYKEIALLLREHYPQYRKKIRTTELPSILIRIYGIINRDVRTLIDELDTMRQYDHSRAVEMFDWKPRTNQEAVLSMADTLIKFGLIS